MTSNISDETLATLRVFIPDAVRAVGACFAGRALPSLQKTKWKESDGAGNYQPETVDEPVYAMAVAKATDAIQKLRGYAGAIDALRTDRTLGLALNGYVGNPNISLRQLSAASMISFIVSGTIDRDRGFQASTDALDETLQNLLRGLGAYLTQTRLVLLPEIESPLIDFGDGLLLDHLNEREIQLVLNSGVVDSPFPDVRRLPSLLCLRQSRQFENRIGIKNPTPDPPDGTGKVSPFDRALNALRIHRNERVLPGGSFSYTDMPFSSGFSFGRGPLPLYRINGVWHLSDDDRQPLKALFGDLENPKVTKHEFINTALRRLQYASERTRDDDKFLDLMIAAEAIFVPQNESELSYKFALRVAKLLDVSGQSRQSVFKRMKDAYSLRSRIAHGSHFSSAEKALVDFVSEVVRLALRKAIRRAIETPNATGGKLFDWDELILGSEM